MSIDRAGSTPTGGPAFNPATETHAPGSEKETTASVSTKNRLVDRLRGFKSGFSGLPGRIQGHFQSLRRQPVELPIDVAIKKIAGSAKAYSVEVDPPSEAGQKAKLAQDAEIAAYPYHRSLDNINDSGKRAEYGANAVDTVNSGGWDTARPLALAAGKAAGLSTKGSDGFIYDKKSGLTAYVLHNPLSSPKEVRLVFGGTTSGKKTGGLNARSLLNRGFTLRQWIANGKNALLGKTPDSYRQAKELTTKVLQMMAADKKYDGFQLTLSGHSKGGGEAAYAALSQEPPVPAICFSSAELGQEMRDAFTHQQKAHATSCITHYNIQGDVVPNIGKVASGLGHIGKVVTLPAEHSWNSPVDRHDKFTRHVHHFADS